MLFRRLSLVRASSPQGAGVEEPRGMQSQVLLRRMTPPRLTSFQVTSRTFMDGQSLLAEIIKTWENLLNDNLNNSMRSKEDDTHFIIIEQK